MEPLLETIVETAPDYSMYFEQVINVQYATLLLLGVMLTYLVFFGRR